MDFSLFEEKCDEVDGRILFQIIGKYRLDIYLGEWGLTRSKPLRADLDLNKYEIIGASIKALCDNGFDSEDSEVTVDLNELGIKGLGLIVSLANLSLPQYYCYDLYVDTLEKVYNRLHEIAGSCSSSNNKEGPCKCCGRMNDIGASVCWGFTCGAENPTAK
jgi:hypothetical protein